MALFCIKMFSLQNSLNLHRELHVLVNISPKSLRLLSKFLYKWNFRRFASQNLVSTGTYSCFIDWLKIQWHIQFVSYAKVLKCCESVVMTNLTIIPLRLTNLITSTVVIFWHNFVLETHTCTLISRWASSELPVHELEHVGQWWHRNTSFIQGNPVIRVTSGISKAKAI